MKTILGILIDVMVWTGLWYAYQGNQIAWNLTTGWIVFLAGMIGVLFFSLCIVAGSDRYYWRKEDETQEEADQRFLDGIAKKPLTGKYPTLSIIRSGTTLLLLAAFGRWVLAFIYAGTWLGIYVCQGMINNTAATIRKERELEREDV